MSDRSQYDVIVIGSGAGGMTAAITAAVNGLKVMVLEKTSAVGGSTAISGGTIWIPVNSVMNTLGLRDNKENVTAYLKESMGGAKLTEQLDSFLDNGPKMLEFLERYTAVRFTGRRLAPDYYPDNQGWMLGGRALDSSPFDGRKLGSFFCQLREPLNSFTVLGGMMVNRTDINHLMRLGRSVESSLYGLKLLGRYATDRLRFSRGTRLVLGNALAGSLFYSALCNGVEFYRNTRAMELIELDGKVSGVRAVSNGTQTDFFAKAGVVLASGGFGANPVLRKRYISTQRHISMSPESNTGDGLDMASRLKAVVPQDNFANAFYTPVSCLKKPNGQEDKFPHLLMDRAKPGLIAIDRYGRRFVNEAICYHEFGKKLQDTGLDGLEAKAHLIVDSRFIRTYGLGLVRPGSFRSYKRYLRSGYLKRSDSLENLAEKIGVPAHVLLEEVRRHNQYAETGVDLDFGKGGSAYDRYLGDETNIPNPCLRSIVLPPFYSVTVYPGDIGTACGLMTDGLARVLRSDGDVIDGLYACGNDMNSVMRGVYPGAGITLGPALTFGYIAGNSLASNSKQR